MTSTKVPARWTIERADAWGESTAPLVGCNYTPRTAINQLEMWQRETFDPVTIDQELGWAQSLGFNSLRVFLHDLLWQQDSAAYLDRIDQFLDIAARHGIGAMLVFFDSCWHPLPQLGKQPEPEPGVHNSGWVQSPGVAVLSDPAKFDVLEDYVTGVVRYFRDDKRVSIWDIWNEPDNQNTASRGARDLGDKKSDVVQPLLEKGFAWARSVDPSQPLTSGIWHGEWENEEMLTSLQRVQIENSDVISFHNYTPADELEKRLGQLKRYGRPLFCTEYMARPQGSTFESALPVFQRHKIGAYCWGFVSGRTQTIFPWDSWQKAYLAEPEVWFHDIFRADGSAYCEKETTFLKSILINGS